MAHGVVLLYCSFALISPLYVCI